MIDYKRDTLSQFKPIETLYKGYKFRSRLEARWGVFFTSLGYKWLYEPEGFEVLGYEHPIRYLPDFYLPDTKTWVEVKGSNEALKADSDKLTAMLDFCSPLPDMSDSYDDTTNNECHGLLILGQIPEPIFGMTLHPIIQHHKGLIWSWFAFEPLVPAVFHYYENPILSYIQNVEPKEWTTDSISIPLKCGFEIVLDSYQAARSARFEHGESP